MFREGFDAERDPGRLNQLALGLDRQDGELIHGLGGADFAPAVVVDGLPVGQEGVQTVARGIHEGALNGQGVMVSPDRGPVDLFQVVFEEHEGSLADRKGKIMRVLSVCTGMGLLDRAFMDAGFDVVPGCEIDPDQRLLYGQLCGGEPLVHDLKDLAPAVEGRSFDGIIGGPPCQSLTRLRAMRKPKFADEVQGLLHVVEHRWFLFENVAPLNILGASSAYMDAMHYAFPHQSRPRWFTFSAGLVAPEPVFHGSVDDLMAYSIVAGRIYGPKRGATLQGYPAASGLKAPCPVLQKGLANAVHYAVGRAWAEAIKSK